MKTQVNEKVRLKKLQKLSKMLKTQPLQFSLTAEEIRKLNRELC
jgi:hypothetical protein